MLFPKCTGYSSVFKIYRFQNLTQKMCRFRVNGRPIRHISNRFQNVPASCERSLSLETQKSLISNEVLNEKNIFCTKKFIIFTTSICCRIIYWGIQNP